MKPLRLDLLPRRRVPFAVWMTLLVGTVLAGDAALRALAMHEEITLAEQAAAQQRQRPGRSFVAQGAALDPALAKDLRAAEQVVQRLALPWDELFRAVETAASDRVALLTIEPDPQKGALSISGEALDYFAVLTYVARLSEPGQLTDVHLVRHETRQDDPRRPLAFTIAASWKPER